MDNVFVSLIIHQEAIQYATDSIAETLMEGKIESVFNNDFIGQSNICDDHRYARDESYFYFFPKDETNRFYSYNRIYSQVDQINLN